MKYTDQQIKEVLASRLDICSCKIESIGNYTYKVNGRVYKYKNLKGKIVFI